MLGSRCWSGLGGGRCCRMTSPALVSNPPSCSPPAPSTQAALSSANGVPANKPRQPNTYQGNAPPRVHTRAPPLPPSHTCVCLRLCCGAVRCTTAHRARTPQVTDVKGAVALGSEEEGGEGVSERVQSSAQCPACCCRRQPQLRPHHPCSSTCFGARCKAQSTCSTPESTRLLPPPMNNQQHHQQRAPCTAHPPGRAPALSGASPAPSAPPALPSWPPAPRPPLHPPPPRSRPPRPPRPRSHCCCRRWCRCCCRPPCRCSPPGSPCPLRRPAAQGSPPPAAGAGAGGCCLAWRPRPRQG